jgi:hypothetical protein
MQSQTATPALYDCPTVTATFEVAGVGSPAINISNEFLANINDLTGCTTSSGSTITGGILSFMGIFGVLMDPAE